MLKFDGDVQEEWFKTSGMESGTSIFNTTTANTFHRFVKQQDVMKTGLNYYRPKVKVFFEWEYKKEGGSARGRRNLMFCMQIKEYF